MRGKILVLTSHFFAHKFYESNNRQRIRRTGSDET